MRKKKEDDLLNQKEYEESRKKIEKIEKEIDSILEDLTVEELSELEAKGDFSKEALEWIKAKKRRKKVKKVQEEFENNLRCSNEVIRRTVLIGKTSGLKNGMYKPQNQFEKKQLLNTLDQINQREERVKERVFGEGRIIGSRSREER